MTACAGTTCAVLPHFAVGAYIAIMLAVVGVPQLLIHYFDHRSRQRDRQEDLAIATERRREDLATADQQRREDLAIAERQRREDLAVAEQQRREDEQRRREDLAAAEQQRRDDLAAADRRHQETMTMLGVTLNSMTTMAAAMMDNRPPAPPAAGPEQAAAIADLRQSAAELTRMVSDRQRQMQNGSISIRHGSVNYPAAAPSQ